MDIKNLSDVISIVASILSIAAILMSWKALKTIKNRIVLKDGNIRTDFKGSGNTLTINVDKIDRRIMEVDTHLKEQEKEAREMNDVDREEIIYLLKNRLVELNAYFQRIKTLNDSPTDEKYRVVLDDINRIEFRINRLSGNS